MTLHLGSGVADVCISVSSRFVDDVAILERSIRRDEQGVVGGAFPTARQIGAVYSLFAGEDLRSLLDGFVVQARAMSVMFAVGGGLLEAQDEAVAAALSKAAAEPVGLVSLGLMSSEVVVTEAACTAGYGRVGPEDLTCDNEVVPVRIGAASAPRVVTLECRAVETGNPDIASDKSGASGTSPVAPEACSRIHAVAAASAIHTRSRVAAASVALVTSLIG